MGLGDRIAVLSEGRLRQVGPPMEVYDDPADTFVATFIGSPPMNLVPRDDVLVGFRPEHLLPAGDRVPDGSVTVKLAVDRVEYLSGDRHVWGTAQGLGEPTRVVSRLPAIVDTPVTPGEEQRFVVAGPRFRFFSAGDGRRTAGVKL
jgi:multiple sugar transport system ATP-binding protein